MPFSHLQKGFRCPRITARGEVIGCGAVQFQSIEHAEEFCFEQGLCFLAVRTKGGTRCHSDAGSNLWDAILEHDVVVGPLCVYGRAISVRVVNCEAQPKAKGATTASRRAAHDSCVRGGRF